MRRKTSFRLAVAAAAVTLGGFGLGLAGPPGADGSAEAELARPLVAIDQRDQRLDARTDDGDKDCPWADREEQLQDTPTEQGV